MLVGFLSAFGIAMVFYAFRARKVEQGSAVLGLSEMLN